MNAILFLLALGPGPDVARLGADDWAAREAEEARCDNPLFALVLPHDHPDPEVAHRLRRLKARNLKWLDPRYAERALHARDFRAWLKRCVVDGDSLAYSLAEIFYELHTDPDKAHAYLELAPPDGRAAWDRNEGLPHWIRGAIHPNEFDLFLAHREAHRRRIPPPREK